jgi:hypothetical protein
MIQTYRLEYAGMSTQRTSTTDKLLATHLKEFFVMKPDSLKIGGVQEHHEITG